jgi:hypothetical protein
MNLTKEDHEQIKIAVEILEMDVKNNWTIVGLPEKVAILKYIEYLEGVIDELDITSS